MKNVNLDWSALEAWQPSKMTSNLPKLGLISFLSLSRTQKTVCPNIPKIWDALIPIGISYKKPENVIVARPAECQIF